MREEEFRQLWGEPATGQDLRRIGVEVPQQFGALFLMDGEEIDRITRDVAPLTDIYPKRLTDEMWDEEGTSASLHLYGRIGSRFNVFFGPH